jgi:hypothetical protein
MRGSHSSSRPTSATEQTTVRNRPIFGLLTVGFVAIQPERDGPPARACDLSGGGYVERN